MSSNDKSISKPQADAPDTRDLQGEGNYDASRRYDQAAHEFAQSGKVEPAARRAHPLSPAEAEEMLRAEREGKAHAKDGSPRDRAADAAYGDPHAAPAPRKPAP